VRLQRFSSEQGLWRDLRRFRVLCRHRRLVGIGYTGELTVVRQGSCSLYETEKETLK